MGDAACAKRLLQEVTFSACHKPLFKYKRAVAHHFYRKSCIRELWKPQPRLHQRTVSFNG